MNQVLVLTSLLHLTAISSCATPMEHKHSQTTYDQRQVGKYNFHFNFKDVAIIAISSEDISGGIGDSSSSADDYDDYESLYQDSEFTVSPVIANLTGRLTTKKPNATLPLQPTISGLTLSSISTNVSNLTDSVTTKKPQTLVVIHEKPSTLKTNITENASNSSARYQPDEIPVKVIVEPVLKSKTQQPKSVKRKLVNRQATNENEDIEEVKIRPRRAQIAERIRLRRAHAQAQNRLLQKSNSAECNTGEIRDGQGGCRTRRSGMSGLLGFLRKFLPQGVRE